MIKFRFAEREKPADLSGLKNSLSHHSVNSLLGFDKTKAI